MGENGYSLSLEGVAFIVTPFLVKCYKDVAKMRVWSYTVFVVVCNIIG